MLRCSSRTTAGMSSRYSCKEYVLASFMKGKKHAVIPVMAININPMNMDKAEIKICGDTTPLTIVSKGTKAQMNMDKTKFARETGSEEVDLGNFFDDDEKEEKENQEQKQKQKQDDFDFSTSHVRPSPSSQRSTIEKESSKNKPSESYCSSRSSINYTTHDFDTVFNSPSTSRKNQHESDSSIDSSGDDIDEDERKFTITAVKLYWFCLLAPPVVNKKSTDTNDSSEMLHKLLNRKKPPAKKRPKITTTNNDLTIVECTGCRDLREQINKITKRVERVERVIPAVKQYYYQKKDIFGVEASEVKGPRERPTIIIRNLFTISNHVTDYREYLETNSALLRDFIQYRCPGIINMDQTWYEIVKSMASLQNDIKKNSKTKLARQLINAPNDKAVS
ncbi:unnamed protein product [Rotaria sp. Silwood2]|nr:unnamed protein product [Rotaria sp. Silwood2]